MTAGRSPAVFSRVAIIGLGLVGGSIAAGLGQRKLAREIVAFDLNLDSLEKGLAQGLITRAAASVVSAVADADLVIIAVPVLSSEAVLRDIPATATITDVGSVKAPLMAASQAVFGRMLPTLVPGHPIAGSERHGVSAANPDLFIDHKVILTPAGDTDPAALSRVRDMWESLGAEVLEMDPHHHDEVLAQTSHLPHLLAYALVDTLSAQGDSLEIFQYAAGGFRDFSRIAASDPVMWRDIFDANGPAVLDILDRYMTELGALRELIAARDSARLQEVFTRAKAARDHFTALQAVTRESVAGNSSGDEVAERSQGNDHDVSQEQESGRR